MALINCALGVCVPFSDLFLIRLDKQEGKKNLSVSYMLLGHRRTHGILKQFSQILSKSESQGKP